ncbi:MAG TPA: hypothetical protein VLR90_09190 [Blastocatellia bacterium]|nr:hypothetical protein [Blastocatellia bacterium]
MTYCPSAVHEGERNIVLRAFVNALGSAPSTFEIQMFSAPLRSLRKAIFFPSGENFGWLSNERPPMIRLASPPLAGIV